MSELLRLDGVACIRGDRLLFENLSLALAPGDALWLRGPNGAGKSSLIRLAAGLLRPAAGTVERRERLALIDEASALDAELPLRRALDFWARVDTVDGHAVDRAMAAMALAPLSDVPVAMLSTGQRKRAAMVRGCMPFRNNCSGNCRWVETTTGSRLQCNTQNWLRRCIWDLEMALLTPSMRAKRPLRPSCPLPKAAVRRPCRSSWR